LRKQGQIIGNLELVTAEKNELQSRVSIQAEQIRELRKEVERLQERKPVVSEAADHKQC
jgi:hypothetical protein